MPVFRSITEANYHQLKYKKQQNITYLTGKSNLIMKELNI